MSKPQRIIEAARKRFRHYGIQKTTMQEIAQDAGIAVGTLYLYFSNKDELVVACAEEFVDAHRREIEAILASDQSAEGKLRAYIVVRFRQAQEMRTNSRHAVELARAVFRVKPDRLQEEGLIMCDAIARILKEGVEAGVFRIANPAADAKIFLYSIAFFFPNALNEPPTPPAEEELLSVVNWFIRAWKGQRVPAKKKARRH
jgi:TetR/AcrR family fatty acid metabolism transcriptional regulator